jgi:hypothetical protein
MSMPYEELLKITELMDRHDEEAKKKKKQV